MKGRTTFVIAHRLATIRNADRILVFDQGRIVETGSFDELVAKGGRFAELAKAQFMAEGETVKRARGCQGRRGPGNLSRTGRDRSRDLRPRPREARMIETLGVPATAQRRRLAGVVLHTVEAAARRTGRSSCCCTAFRNSGGAGGGRSRPLRGAGLRVLAPDQRGYGLHATSRSASPAYNLDVLAARTWSASIGRSSGAAERPPASGTTGAASSPGGWRPGIRSGSSASSS